PYLLPRIARGDRARPGGRQARLWRAANPASRARRGRVPQPGLGPCRGPRDVAAVPAEEASGFAVDRAAGRLAAGGGDRSLHLYTRAETPRPQIGRASCRERV